MSTTVAQHSVATFTSPVNGTTPIDANTVRGNDNTIRTAYNTHDADPGIHVQSSTLASRPTAGTAGRKWITEDSGVYTLWFDDGTNWHPVSSENVALTVLATEALAKGDVVKVTGWNNGQDLPEVAKVSSASDIAFAVMSAAATINTMGYATNTGIVQDLNTNSFNVGDILYPSSSGGFTATKPTSGLYQMVGYVLRKNSSNGVIFVEFSGPRIVEASANTASTVVLRDASGNFAAGTITAALTGNVTGNVTGNASTATALQTARTINGTSFDGTANITVTAAAGTLTGTTLASNVVSSSLTSVGTLANLTVTNPISGSVTGSSGSTTGNAATATKLATARNINGVSFDGTADITVTAAAGTLTGTTLASGVTASSLTSVGTLSSLTVSGDLTVDTSTLKVDSTNNRVGVGAASPAYSLDVYGSSPDIVAFHNGANGTRVGITATNTAAYIGTTYSSSGIPLIFTRAGIGASGTESMRLDGGGNLGLGVTPSAWTLGRVLQVGGVSAFWDYSGSTYLTNNRAFVGGNKYIANGYATSYEQDSGAHKWLTAPSGTAGDAISFTQAMTLDASGNLLVNRTSALTGSLVSVDGSVGVNGASGGGVFRLFNAGTQYGGIASAAWAFGGSYSGSDLCVLAANALIFGSNGTTERARITAGGYFKASDAGTYLGSTVAYHELRTSQSDEFIARLTNTASSLPYGIAIKFTAASPNDAIKVFLNCSDSTTSRLDLRSDGGIANYQANDTNLSDVRTKKDITPLASYWDKLKAIEIVTFRYKDQTHDDLNIGVIAQQVETVAPELIDVDGFGETPADGVPLKTVYTTDLYHASIRALQEAMARIETLEQRVLALGA